MARSRRQVKTAHSIRNWHPPTHQRKAARTRRHAFVAASWPGGAPPRCHPERGPAAGPSRRISSGSAVSVREMVRSRARRTGRDPCRREVKRGEMGQEGPLRGARSTDRRRGCGSSWETPWVFQLAAEYAKRLPQPGQLPQPENADSARAPIESAVFLQSKKGVDQTCHAGCPRCGIESATPDILFHLQL